MTDAQSVENHEENPLKRGGGRRLLADRAEDPVAISYSGGASSEWIINALLTEVIPRPAHVAVFFSDTTDEHVWTYEAVERVEERCKREGLTFIRCGRDEGLRDHLLAINAEGRTRADHPPVYVLKGNGVGRIEHRCTREFKVAPMRRAQSAWLKSLGLPKAITKWVGYGADEAHRATHSVAQIIKEGIQWERLDFPAIRLGKTREAQREELRRATGSAPRFSMCRICPYKTPERWRDLAEADRAPVYEVDEAIRDMSNVGVTEGDCYLTNRTIPVQRLLEKGDPQPFLPGFESYCDGGACFL